MSRCVCCDLPIESCGKAVEDRARQHAANERSQVLARPGWFPARYPGQCAGCGEHFAEGDPICRIGESGTYKSHCCVNLPD